MRKHTLISSVVFLVVLAVACAQAPSATPAPTSTPVPTARPIPTATSGPSIQTRTLFEQRVEQLPQQPLCWDVRTGSLAPGAKSPATGFHTHGWVVAYLTGGTERVTYAGGASFTVNAGGGILFEAGKPHVHESVGTVPRTNIGFELTCQRQQNSTGTSGPLPGIRSGPVPYQVQLRERTWPSGAQTPVHILSGPTTTLLREGTIGQSTSSGTARFGPGDLYVSPVGELAQNTCVSSTPCRTLDVDTWPSGETRSVAQPGKILPRP
jgi:quercetin dioxygenase-like cupin family protein